MTPLICGLCGRTLQLGEWPFCPHGVGSSSVIGDACDLVQENGFPTPRRFTSKAERIRALAERGLEERVCWAGPLDRHVTRWAGMDAQTLDNAAALVDPARRGRTASGREVTVSSGLSVTWTTRVIE